MPDRLRVAVLTSSRAPGLAALLQHPQRGLLFDISWVYAPEAPPPPRPLRAGHDAALARMLKAADADTVLLLGYLYVLTAPMLSAFPNRILNIHDSDLSIYGDDGKRRYRGLHSTRDAILCGERSTRSTAHVVTATLDDGPIVLMTKPYPLSPHAIDAARRRDIQAVKRHAWLQRERMMSDWGDLAAGALELLAACEVAA